MDVVMSVLGLIVILGCMWRVLWLVHTFRDRSIASTLLRMTLPVAAVFFMFAVVLLGTGNVGAMVALFAAGISLLILPAAAAMVSVSVSRS
jgi:hypothetical protein